MYSYGHFLLFRTLIPISRIPLGSGANFALGITVTATSLPKHRDSTFRSDSDGPNRTLDFQRPTIRVTDSIQVGRINVPLTALGKVNSLSGEPMKAERGPGLSPGAQFLIRGDIKSMIKVAVTDPNDPTAYLLISTRKPEELASAINANRS